MNKFLSGNEAIARGAYEYGVHFAIAYPGTPSTEILENIAKYKKINSEWSINEKVAYESAWGASLAGARVLVAMKHVGLNVAADPFVTSIYTGVNGGFVLVVADDPGMWSSQNEQDDRNYAKFAKVPMLEPSDSQETKNFVGEALRISEEFDIPVLLRISTRISHSKGIVEVGERKEFSIKGYEKNTKKYTMLPANARARRLDLKIRLERLKKFSEKFEYNRLEWGERDIGIITAGISYQYAKEAFPEASFLKISMTYPLPEDKIREFASKVKKLIVVEELDPFMEEQIKAMGIQVEGKNLISEIGELSAEKVRESLNGITKLEVKSEKTKEVEIPKRPPILCAGCPHRAISYVLNRLKVVISGDIGCYTLGALPPLNAMDTCLCMGASISAASGLSKIATNKKVVGVIGDSTFIHSGITGLIDCVYNKRDVTLCILDNHITAMTGHQVNPGTGLTLKGEQTNILDIKALCQAIGVPHIKVVDALDIKKIREVVKEELDFKDVSVIIVRGNCIVYEKKYINPPFKVIPEKCNECGACFNLGCPAIEKHNGKAVINEVLCVGCGLCLQVCKFNAFTK